MIAKHRPVSAVGSADWQATNLRSQFERILRRAGVKPWARLWVNLRSSRATELADSFPSHVCAEWLGHCERVANEHYRQTTRDHFEKAITPSECSALHVALQSGTELGGSERLSPLASPTIRTKNATTCKKQGVPSQNLEPLRWTIQDSNGVSASHVDETSYGDSSLLNVASAARGAALLGEVGFEDSDLAFVAQAWPSLATEVREQIVAMARRAIELRENTE